MAKRKARLCRAAWCTTKVYAVSDWCAKHRPVRYCGEPGCTTTLRSDNTSGRCGSHWKPLRFCAEEGCGTRLSGGSTGRCQAHANALAAQARRKPPAEPKPEKPTKLSKHRLDQMRLSRKLNPRGPACTGPGCTNRLSQPSQGKSPPLCMECRVSTGQLARVLKAAPRPVLQRDEAGMFLPNPDPAPPPKRSST